MYVLCLHHHQRSADAAAIARCRCYCLCCCPCCSPCCCRCCPCCCCLLLSLLLPLPMMSWCCCWRLLLYGAVLLSSYFYLEINTGVKIRNHRDIFSVARVTRFVATVAVLMRRKCSHNRESAASDCDADDAGESGRLLPLRLRLLLLLMLLLLLQQLRFQLHAANDDGDAKCRICCFSWCITSSHSGMIVAAIIRYAV